MKILAIIGPGSSGVSAFLDFVKLNTRYYSIVKEHEFCLLQGPYGFLNLYEN